MCCDEAGAAAEPLAAFAQMLSAWFHFEKHARLERMKDAYAPFNPDRDTRVLETPDAHALAERSHAFTADLRSMIEDANFEAISAADLERAMEAESLFQIRLHVDFDDFEEVLFFRRGSSEREETLSRWFGLAKRTIRFRNYERVVVYVRFRDAQWFADRNRKDLNFEPGSVILKLFQNVPEADLEMLFPNSEVRMKTMDKLAIGIPAAVSGLVVLFTKMGATLVLIGALLAFWLGLSSEPVSIDQAALLALASGLGALGGYIWKQFSSFNNRRMRFMKALSENLYFRNLANNVGVFYQLSDSAEEEECKEVLLAMYFLTRRGAMSAEALDAAIEAWFRERWEVTLDFDVRDALDKLERLGLARREADAWIARPLDEARNHLDTLWDDAFQRTSEAGNLA